MYDRIVIGTANWWNEYNNSLVTEQDQKEIIQFCNSVGIKWIEVSPAYGTQDIAPEGWNRILKLKTGDKWTIGDLDTKILLSHDAKSSYEVSCIAEAVEVCNGDSVYHDDDRLLDIGSDYMEIPYSIMDRTAETYMTNDTKWIARSVFLRGKCLDFAEAADCVKFVLMNPLIDKVVIGADNVDQLRESVGWIESYEYMKETDPDIIDPRRW